jgi:hypothetical protein
MELRIRWLLAWASETDAKHRATLEIDSATQLQQQHEGALSAKTQLRLRDLRN